MRSSVQILVMLETFPLWLLQVLGAHLGNSAVKEYTWSLPVLDETKDGDGKVW